VSKIKSDKKSGILPQPTFDQSEISDFCIIERTSQANIQAINQQLLLSLGSSTLMHMEATLNLCLYCSLGKLL
jgi:hypothetical protein